MWRSSGKRGVIPVRPELLRRLLPSGINRYVDIITLRTVEEGKLRLTVCWLLNA
jgi:hypothetical protein